jgi:uncharacterized repeat protein (TIGR01451 family)
MKPKLTPIVLVFGLALTSVIGTIIRPANPIKAAVSAPANGGLTITKLGSGSGTIVSTSYTGINCGTDCYEFYGSPVDVILSATASLDSAFTGWGGYCNGTVMTCTVSMTDDRDVTAYFTLVYTATVAKEGNGSGSVTSSPAGIDCGAICSASFYSNTVVTLTAAVDTGSQFSGWTGDCAADGLDCITTLSAAKDITATFALITYTVSAAKDGNGDGTITSTPSGIDCGDTCSTSFGYNTVVTFTAVPTSGSRVDGWAGDCAADGSICVTTVTATQNVTATFRMITTNLAVSQTYARRTGAITFTVVVVNYGPAEVSGAIVSDTIPPDITRPQWSCQAANGASCPNTSASMSSTSCRNTLGRSAEASGSGYLIHDTLPALPVGGVVTYTIRGNICMYISEMVNQVDVIPPNSIIDISHADNTAIITTGYRVMIPIVLKD